jgi:hypothetical protein
MGVELTRSEVEKISLQDPLPPVRGRRILPAVEDDGFDLHDGKSAQGGGPQLPMLMAKIMCLVRTGRFRSIYIGRYNPLDRFWLHV